MFGIQLNTIAAEMVFGIPCEELKNWSFDGKEILRKDFYYILDHIREAPDFHTRARWLESYIYKKVSDQGDFHLLQKISSVLDKLPVESGKDIAIEDLTGYSRMHTFRLFKKWYGTSPSEAVNFKRFIHALQHMHHSGVSLTEIGLRCGYYDQSHFIRDFKQYAEMVPSQYLQNKSFVLGQINIDQLDFDMLH
jgi:AraC-like DNA-binding protein